MRGFLAIDPSPEARAETARLLEALRAAAPDAPVGWDRPEKLHLTLKFLGDVRDPVALAAAVRAAVAGAGPVALSLAPAGTFGDPRPKVVWLGLGGDLTRLGALVAAIERAVAPLGHPPEGRPFVPHITLGRVRGDRGRRGRGPGRGPAGDPTRTLVAALRALPPPAPAPFVATEVVLYESQPGPGGSTYVPRERFALQAS